MPQSSRVSRGEERFVSRRAVVKGGLATAAGAVATLMAARTGTTAVTPMDVKRPGFTQFSAPTTTTTTTQVSDGTKD